MTTPDLWNLRDYAMTMAAYNVWMNRKVYDAAASLSDEERKRDRGAFFGSIHGTLNHLLLGDTAWMQRLHGEPVTMKTPRDELFADFGELRAAREAMDARITAFAAALEPVPADRSFTFTSVTYKRDFTMPYAAAVLQVFNHQTHHRGQVTTLLTQAGVDVGVTDLPAMPGHSGRG